MSLVLDQRREALGGHGQGGGGEVARDPVVAHRRAKGRDVEVVQDVALGAAVPGLPDRVGQAGIRGLADHLLILAPMGCIPIYASSDDAPAASPDRFR